MKGVSGLLRHEFDLAIGDVDMELFLTQALFCLFCLVLRATASAPLAPCTSMATGHNLRPAMAQYGIAYSQAFKQARAP